MDLRDRDVSKIVSIGTAPDNSTRLILLAADGLELHLDETVFDARVVLDTNGISRHAGLPENVRFAGGRFVLIDGPFRIAIAGFGRGPTRWRFAGFGGVKTDGIGQDAAGDQTGRSEQCVDGLHPLSSGLVLPRGFLHVESLLQAAGQGFSRALAPIMEKERARLLVRLVLIRVRALRPVADWRNANVMPQT
jgi:hypothetical protein